MLSWAGLVTTAAVVVSCGERRVWCGICVLQATFRGMVVVADGELQQ